MPLPMMILPVEKPPSSGEISSAVEKVLVTTGAITANTLAKEILNENGFTVEDTLLNLGNLSRTARDAVRLSAVKDILDIHGLQFRKDAISDSRPTVTFNVQTETGTVNMNSLFVPERQS